MPPEPGQDWAAPRRSWPRRRCRRHRLAQRCGDADADHIDACQPGQINEVSGRHGSKDPPSAKEYVPPHRGSFSLTSGSSPRPRQSTTSQRRITSRFGTERYVAKHLGDVNNTTDRSEDLGGRIATDLSAAGPGVSRRNTTCTPTAGSCPRDGRGAGQRDQHDPGAVATGSVAPDSFARPELECGSIRHVMRSTVVVPCATGPLRVSRGPTKALVSATVAW